MLSVILQYLKSIQKSFLPDGRIDECAGINSGDRQLNFSLSERYKQSFQATPVSTGVAFYL